MANKILVPILVVVGLLGLLTITGMLLIDKDEKVEYEFKPQVIQSSEAIRYSLAYGTYEVSNKEEASNLLRLGYIEIIPNK